MKKWTRTEYCLLVVVVCDICQAIWMLAILFNVSEIVRDLKVGAQ